MNWNNCNTFWFENEASWGCVHFFFGCNLWLMLNRKCNNILLAQHQFCWAVLTILIMCSAINQFTGQKFAHIYRVIKNDCQGFNNSPGHLVLQMQPHVIPFYGVTSRIGFMFLLFKYPRTEGTNQNCHWNHHHWHATNSLERTPLSCWCL